MNMITVPLDAYACPRCANLVGIVWRHGWSSVGRTALAFVALLSLWLVLRVSPLPAVLVDLAAVATATALAATLLCAATAPFARNRCKACGHRWR